MINEVLLHGLGRGLLWGRLRPDGKSPWPILVHDAHVFANDRACQDRMALKILHPVLTKKMLTIMFRPGLWQRRGLNVGTNRWSYGIPMTATTGA